MMLSTFPRLDFAICMTLAVFFGLPAAGQDLQLEQGAVGTYLRLKELQTTGCVLHVVAHPDDEDGAMLAYAARGMGARTLLFSITRGEGGANLISSHFFDELGALRTLEHRKAASYYGNELFYSRAADYGYSKTLEEAMKQWRNGLPILEDLVEVIRRERPTVLLSRFRGDPRDGHGHHQMAGVLSRLAFDAAADATQFPQQLKRGLTPWQIKKLYVRAGSFWREPEENEWTIAIPTGSYDPVIGRTYAQIARFGLGFQRSQGMSGHDGEPGMRYSYYRLVRQAEGELSSARESSLFDGIDTSLAALVTAAETPLLRDTKQRLERMQQQLAEIYHAWDPLRREPTVKSLLDVLVQLRALEVWQEQEPSAAPQQLRRDLRRVEEKLQTAIVTAAGIAFDAWATDLDGEDINHATHAEPIRTHIRIANQTDALPVHVQSVFVTAPGQVVGLEELAVQKLPSGQVLNSELDLDTSSVAPTKPYWQRESIAQPLYDVEEGGGQRPVPSPPFRVMAELKLLEQTLDLETTVRVRQRHPEYGRVTYPLTVAPPMDVRFPLQSGLLAKGNPHYSVSVVVRSCVGRPATSVVRLELPTGWNSTPPEHELTFSREDEVATATFNVSLPANIQAGTHEIRAEVQFEGQSYREGFQTVSASQVGRMNVYRRARHRIQVADVQLAGSPAVGYIAGSGDQVAESLGALGISSTLLGESDLAAGDLSRFDVILVGVRAYAVREDVRRYNARLLDYVKRGGVLIVQYQTPEFDQNFGPYPYEMGRRPEEVSEEDARITVLEPNHPVLTMPNRITAADFQGWYEQRGSKFWQTWDDHYTPLFECHDAGQPPQRGGMLVAPYGNGVYVYSAYSWYRQLPEGVPGAYRIFANLLSLPQSELVR